jgi:hypothetical protein
MDPRAPQRGLAMLISRTNLRTSGAALRLAGRHSTVTSIAKMSRTRRVAI